MVKKRTLPGCKKRKILNAKQNMRKQISKIHINTFYVTALLIMNQKLKDNIYSIQNIVVDMDIGFMMACVSRFNIEIIDP